MVIIGQLIIAGLVWGGLYVLMASGLNLIYGVMQILNIAHGEFMMLSAYITYWLFTLWGISPIVSLFITIPMMFAFGLIVERLTVRPIIARSKNIVEVENATLIVFFGVLLVLQNSVQLLWSADYRSINYLSQTVNFFGISVAVNRLVVFGVALLFTLIIYYFLNRTKIGLALRAVSQDSDTALLMGVDKKIIGLLGFGIGVTLAGVSGSMVTMIYVITPTIGLLFTIKAFTVMVLGGLGNQVGTLAAGLALGLSESLISYVVGQQYRDGIGYVILVCFILWQARRRFSMEG